MNIIGDIIKREMEYTHGVYILNNIGAFTDNDIDILLNELPQWRRNEAEAYKHSNGKRECVLAFVLLKHVLYEHWNITEEIVFNYLKHGKPILSGYPNIHFSISHCRDAIACAVSHSPIGIDIEHRGRYKERLARHVLSEKEMFDVQHANNPDSVFLRYWTAKEALLKLTGDGISGEMKYVLENNKSICVMTFEGDSFVCSFAKFQPDFRC